MNLSRNGLIVLISVIFVAGAGTAYAGIVLPTITLSGNVVVTDDFTVDTDTLVVDSTNDRVGIGIATPTSKLHVVGDLTLQSNIICIDCIDSADILDGTITSADIGNGQVMPADVGFNYAGSTSKGGAASDVACAGCVDPSDLGAGTGYPGTTNGPSVYSNSEVHNIPAGKFSDALSESCDTGDKLITGGFRTVTGKLDVVVFTSQQGTMGGGDGVPVQQAWFVGAWNPGANTAEIFVHVTCANTNP